MNEIQFFRPLLLILLLAGVQLSAQEDENAAAEDYPIIPADKFDRGTPLQSAYGFLAAHDDADYERAAEYLDLRNLRGDATNLTGAQLARRLSVVIQRATWIDVNTLIDDPAGRSNDGLPSYRDSIGVILNEDREIQLLMQKVPRDDGVSIWKVSNATVSLIPGLYATYGYPEFVESLRRSLPQVTFMGYELFKWVIVIAGAILVYAVALLFALAIRRALGNPETPSHRRIFRFLVLPVGIWAVIMSVNAIATLLGRGETAEIIQRFSPLSILVTVWVIYAGIDLLRYISSNVLQRKGRPSASLLLGPAGNAVKLLIALSAVLIYMDKLGINITTVLAGLGIGGIAVALALQKPMENVFGAITLYTQQPVRVGDFCQIGSETGTIEEIGLQSTRIRTLANTLIAIPNARLANEPIDNISARQKILYRPILPLRYDTSPEQLKEILEGIRDLLASHDRVQQDNHRVRFKEFADDALLIEVYAYLSTTDWSVYMQLAEELNLQILEIVTRSGTALSQPARTLQIERGENEGDVATSTSNKH